MTPNAVKLLGEVRKFYLTSHDFNGLPLRDGVDALIIEAATQLVSVGLLQAVAEGVDFPNPHIRPWPSKRTVADQVDSLEALTRDDVSSDVCLYPTPQGMKGVRLPKRFAGRPYEIDIAKGQGVLELVYFTPDVLEFYRNDPRYHCRIDDFSVLMSVTDSVYGDEGEPEKDKVSLAHIGFAYDLSKYDRSDPTSPIVRRVAVFSGDLASLSPEHQQRWRTFSVTDSGLKAHPEWWANQMGHWGEGIGPFSRMFVTINEINELFINISGEKLFKIDEVPDDYGWLLRSSQREWDDFIHTTDKLLSEGLRSEAFEAMKIPGKDEKGTTIGTLRRLELLMLNSKIREEIARTCLASFREVRSARQRPAHSLRANITDDTFVHKQVALMHRINESLKCIRIWLESHPNNKDWVPEHDDLQDYSM
jgi:hypothetical protein